MDLPHGPRKGEFGYDTWEDGAADYVGNSGTWTMMSADTKNGLVYVAGDTPSTTSTAASARRRPASPSVVCIDAKTGKRA